MSRILNIGFALLVFIALASHAVWAAAPNDKEREAEAKRLEEKRNALEVKEGIELLRSQDPKDWELGKEKLSKCGGAAIEALEGVCGAARNSGDKETFARFDEAKIEIQGRQNIAIMVNDLKALIEILNKGRSDGGVQPKDLIQNLNYLAEKCGATEEQRAKALKEAFPDADEKDLAAALGNAKYNRWVLGKDGGISTIEVAPIRAIRVIGAPTGDAPAEDAPDPR